ncbi:MAG: hypothetical protein IKZ25_02525 [Clostridia bacterium]|nr:hypothetical protein [Clostridia bacterium]
MTFELKRTLNLEVNKPLPSKKILAIANVLFNEMLESLSYEITVENDGDITLYCDSVKYIDLESIIDAINYESFKINFRLTGIGNIKRYEEKGDGYVDQLFNILKSERSKIEMRLLSVLPSDNNVFVEVMGKNLGRYRCIGAEDIGEKKSPWEKAELPFSAGDYKNVLENLKLTKFDFQSFMENLRKNRVEKNECVFFYNDELTSRNIFMEAYVMQENGLQCYNLTV